MRPFLFLLLLTGSATADYVFFYDGNQLYSQLVVCVPLGVSSEMTEANIDRTRDCNRAVGYVMGVTDSLRVASDVEQACMSSGIGNFQLGDVVELWLRNNPAKRNLDAAFLVQQAILEAWPCPEE